MSPSFRCDRCGYETIDESLPDCPICGGNLDIVDEEEGVVPQSDSRVEDEENWELNI